jgi:hypothetical protein
MKKLLIMVLVIFGGYLAFQFLTTGEVTLPGDSELTPDQQMLRQLEADFRSARDAFETAWVSDEMTSDEASAVVADAVREAERVAKELDDVAPRLKSEVDRARAARLEIEVRKFLKEAR